MPLLGARRCRGRAGSPRPARNGFHQESTMTRRALGACFLLLGLTAPAAIAQTPIADDAARQANLRAYVELLRADIRAEKVGIITELMAFTEAEDKAFWPIYREYDTELMALNDEKL